MPDLASAQWDFLVDTLRNEANLPQGSSPNASGRLLGIQYVDYSLDFWSEKVPAIGVQLKNAREGFNGITLRGSTTRHVVVTTFHILVAAQSTDASAVARFSGNAPANLSDAMQILRAYITDPAGLLGLSPVLRDPQYRNLGTTNGLVNAARSQILDIDYNWDAGKGEAPQMWAYALITFAAEALVSIT